MAWQVAESFIRDVTRWEIMLNRYKKRAKKQQCIIASFIGIKEEILKKYKKLSTHVFQLVLSCTVIIVLLLILNTFCF